jgi:hypothetical protein
MFTGSLSRPGGVDPEKFYQKYEAMKEDYDSLRKRYADLHATHSATVNKLELSQVTVRVMVLEATLYYSLISNVNVTLSRKAFSFNNIPSSLDLDLTYRMR